MNDKKLKEYKWIFWQLFINTFIILILAINKVSIINIILMILYSLFIFKLKEDRQILISIIVFILLDFILQNIWYATSLNINVYLIIMKLIIIIALSMKALVNIKKYKNILKDPVFLLMILFMLFNLINILYRKISLADLVSGIFTYILLLIFYIITSNNDINFECMYKIIFWVQGPIVIFQSYIYKDQDHRSGFFGLYGITFAMIFLSLYIYYKFIKYLNKQEKLVNIIIVILYTFSIFIISEAKMAFFIIPCCLAFIFIINKGNIVKKLVMSIFIAFIILLSMNLIIKAFPSFKDIMFNKEGLVDYAVNQKPGAYKFTRFENLKLTNDILLPYKGDKLLGVGIGSALRDKQLVYDRFSKGRGFRITKVSEYAREYESWGYTLTSLNVLYLEGGYIGIIIISICLVIMFFRGIRLLKISKSDDDRALGISYSCIIITFIGISWYTNLLYSTNFMVLFWSISGFVLRKINVNRERKYE